MIKPSYKFKYSVEIPEKDLKKIIREHVKKVDPLFDSDSISMEYNEYEGTMKVEIIR